MGCLRRLPARGPPSRPPQPPAPPAGLRPPAVFWCVTLPERGSPEAPTPPSVGASLLVPLSHPALTPGKPSSLLGSPLPAGSAAPLPGKGRVCPASRGRPDRTTTGCGSDDRCQSFPVLEQSRGRARPSGGAEKALSPRPAPGGLAYSLACGLTLLVSARLHLASSSSVLPRGPGICPLTPWLLPGRDLLLCCPPEGCGCPSSVASSHDSWGSAALRARAGCPCHPVSGTVPARGMGCSINISLIVWSQTAPCHRIRLCRVWVMAQPRAAAAPSWSCSLCPGPKHQWPSTPHPPGDLGAKGTGGWVLGIRGKSSDYVLGAVRGCLVLEGQPS